MDTAHRQALIGSAFIVLGAVAFSSKSILIKLAYADTAQLDATRPWWCC